MKKQLLLLCLVLPFLSFGQLKVPELWSGHVHDEAHILSEGLVAQLEQRLKTHEDSTSNQIAVLIIPSLEGEVMEEYTLRVAETWKLGTKNNDNGVLLFIAIDDKKVRIEVGEGLEGALTDATSNQIIRNEIAPHFRQGDYDGGVAAAVDGIISAIKGEYHAEAQRDTNPKRRGFPFLSILGIILFIIIVSLRNRGGRGGGWSSGTGWYGGGFGGGGGGWGGGGGGGFSGGGGGFSGGGSSGSW
jgi:uncharacterized protein